MSKRFVNRKSELEYLEDRYSSGQAELLVIYGRRSVGKTYLLTQGLQEESVYLLAEESETVLEDFSSILSQRFNDVVLKENPLRTWKAFFTYLGQKAKDRRTLVIIDEVQYASKAYKPFMSVLQTQWDTHLKNSKIMLVLCGSLMSFMEGTLSGRSPIYGRRTGAWKLEPMGFLDLARFHEIPIEEAFKVYSVFGGVPQYWRDYHPEKEFWDNLERLLFSRGGRYYDEPKYLLREGVREVSRYFSILRTIASGTTTFGNIASKAKVNTNSLGKYLTVLEDMGYIEKEVPVMGRKGRYVVKDNLFHFWFEYVYPRKHLIERGEDITQEVKQHFNRYLGKKYEMVAREFLEARGGLPVKTSRIGPWYHKGEEIDLVALEDDKGMFFEVKWSELNREEVEDTLKTLERKAERFELKEKHYGLVTKDAPKGELVFTLKDMEQLIHE